MQAAALEQRGQTVHMHDAEDWRWNREGHNCSANYRAIGLAVSVYLSCGFYRQ
jgi:hypothetical protein